MTKTDFRKTSAERKDAVLYKDTISGKEKWIPRDPKELLKPKRKPQPEEIKKPLEDKDYIKNLFAKYE